MNKTPNYSLNQWEATDKVQRVDFNADNAKIDAAMAAMPVITTGIYTGDGVNDREVILGFRAKALLVIRNGALLNVSTGYMNLANGGLALDGYPSTSVSGNVLAITDQGFTVRNWGEYGANVEGARYHYLAIH